MNKAKLVWCALILSMLVWCLIPLIKMVGMLPLPHASSGGDLDMLKSETTEGLPIEWTVRSTLYNIGFTSQPGQVIVAYWNGWEFAYDEVEMPEDLVLGNFTYNNYYSWSAEHGTTLPTMVMFIFISDTEVRTFTYSLNGEISKQDIFYFEEGISLGGGIPLGFGNYCNATYYTLTQTEDTWEWTTRPMSMEQVPFEQVRHCR